MSAVLPSELEAIVQERVAAELFKRQQQPAAAVMPPQPVEDFAYFDGVKVMHADRLAVYRQLMIATRGKPNELQNKVFAVKPDEPDLEKLMESWNAAEQLVLLVRHLFKMQPFNPQTGQGARDEHCWTVWDAFCEAMDDEKKNPGIGPTSFSATESPPASPQPTPNTSA